MLIKEIINCCKGSKKAQYSHNIENFINQRNSPVKCHSLHVFFMKSCLQIPFPEFVRASCKTEIGYKQKGNSRHNRQQCAYYTEYKRYKSKYYQQLFKYFFNHLLSLYFLIYISLADPSVLSNLFHSAFFIHALCNIAVKVVEY